MKKVLLSVLLGGVCLLTGCRSPLVVTTVEDTFTVVNGVGQPIEVSGGLQEKVDKFVPHTLPKMNGYLSSQVEARNFAATYPYPFDKDIGDFFHADPIGGEDLQAVNAAAGQLFDKRIERIVDPAWADSIVQEAAAAAKAKLARADVPDRFDEAREIAWNPRLTKRPRVDAMVADKLGDFIVETVNPAQWKAVSAAMQADFDKCIAEKRFGDVAGLLKPEDGQVRTYSRKLAAPPKASPKDTVEAEGRIGTAALNKRIVNFKSDLARKWEESFKDWADQAFAPAREAAQAKLKAGDFAGARAAAFGAAANKPEKVVALLMAQATEVVNKEINPAEWKKLEGELTKGFDDLVAEKKFGEAIKLVDAHPQINAGAVPPSALKDMTDGEAGLGTGALRAKTDALKKKLHAAWEATFPDWAEHVFSGARTTVEGMLKKHDFAAARLAAWNCTMSGNARVDAMIREKAVAYINTVVNMQYMSYAETTVTTRIEQLFAEKRFSEALVFVLNYELAGLDNLPEAVRKDMTETKDALGTGRLVSRFELLRAKLLDQVEEAFWKHVKATVTAKTDQLIADKKFDEAIEYVQNYKMAGLGEALAAAEAQAEKAAKDAKEAKSKKAWRERAAQDIKARTERLNARFEALRAELVAKIRKAKKEDFDRRQAAKLRALVKQVVEDVKANRYDPARDAIRDFALVDDEEWNMTFYKARVGLLDSVVNPNQLNYLREEAGRKIADLVAAKRIAEARKFVTEYPYVHDTFADIMGALDAVEKAMVGLNVEEKRAAEYIRGLKARINEVLEKRWGKREENFSKEELAELEKALGAFKGGLLGQQYNVPSAVMLTNEVENAVILMSNRKLPPMTTWELNEALGRFMVDEMARLNAIDEKARPVLEAKVQASVQAVTPRPQKPRAGLDKRTSYDAQIAMAEAFIKRPGSPLELEALLGDYARIMRRQKLGSECTRDEANTLLVGAVCLNQESVFQFALEQGADVDAVPRRTALPALLQAIKMERYEFVPRLRAAKCSMKVRDGQGRTALHYAVERGNLELADALLADIDVTVADNAGRTVLFTAVERNQLAVAKWLIDQAGNRARKFVEMKAAAGGVEIPDLSPLRRDRSLTAFDYACGVNAHMLLDLLAETGASYDEADLALALANDCPGAAQWLVEHALDVNHPVVHKGVRDGSDNTATLRYLRAEGLKPGVSK